MICQTFRYIKYLETFRLYKVYVYGIPYTTGNCLLPTVWCYLSPAYYQMPSVAVAYFFLRYHFRSAFCVKNKLQQSLLYRLRLIVSSERNFLWNDIAGGRDGGGGGCFTEEYGKKSFPQFYIHDIGPNTFKGFS